MKTKSIISKSYVFDFDDCLVTTSALIHVYHSKSGKFIKSMNTKELNNYNKKDFYTLDFSDFVSPYIIAKAKPYKAWNILEKIDKKISKGLIFADLFILTGRTNHVQKAIFNLLKSKDIKNMPANQILCIGDGKGEINIAKEKKKELKKIEKKYDEIYFFDDDKENIHFANSIKKIKTKLIEMDI